MTVDTSALLADPRWLAHRHDAASDCIHFIAVDRERRRSVPFLTDEYLGAATPVVVPRAAAVALARPAPLQFLFHAAFCCSTLLTKVLDHPGLASTLSEPVILNDLVGWRHRGAEPDAIGGVLESALTLLARPFDAAHEQMVIKPSNVVNGLALAILTMRPDARALLMYAPLEVYLASIARKGMWGRLWVRDLLSRQLADGLVDLGFEAADYLKLTDLQVAAVGWLAQADLFATLHARFPDRVRTLNSEQLLARPRETMEALTTLYGWRVNSATIDTLVASDAFTRNTKDGSAFAPGERVREQARGAAIHADEIHKVAAWATAVAANAGIAPITPAPLLG